MATREEHAVSLKLPTFWTSQPEVWFTQAEAQFNLRRITSDETKYFYVVAALDQDTATRLIDLIQRPPDTDKYNKLKERLVDTFGLSRRERASRLLHFRPLGDSKPSSLMDEILALGGDHVACPLFEQLFLERLPDDIRQSSRQRPEVNTFCHTFNLLCIPHYVICVPNGKTWLFFVLC